MQKRSFAVLGLGKYGSALAESLYDMGMDVLVADRNQETIQAFSDKSTVAVCCNLADEDDVKALGLGAMDCVVVAMGSDFEASVLCVVTAKELGVPQIVAKASTACKAGVLRKVGADRIIDPEAENGVRSARILASPLIFDYFDMNDNLCMIEMVPEAGWIGKCLRELNLRAKRGINVIATRDKETSWDFSDPDRPITKETRLLVALRKRDLHVYQ